MRQYKYSLKELVDGYTKGEFEGLINGSLQKGTTANSRNLLETHHSQGSHKRGTKSGEKSTATTVLKRLTSNQLTLKSKKEFFTKLQIKLNSGKYMSSSSLNEEAGTGGAFSKKPNDGSNWRNAKN
jgi:hypothetical protein